METDYIFDSDWLRLISFQDKNSYKDDFGDSDNEVVPDAYLERVIAEGEERDSDEGDDDSDESTDEDFNPDKEKVEDVADEYDSNVSTSSNDDDEEGGSDDSGKKSKKNKEKKKKKERREKSSSGSVRSVAIFLCDWIFIVKYSHLQSKSKSKKDKDDNKPKRAGTAFMMWLNETREQIKRDNPGIKVTEIAKKGGEMWRELKDKSVWEEKAAKDKERYANEMKSYKPSGNGESSSGGKSSSKRKKESPKKSTTTTMAGSGFKSKEYISEDDSSANSEDDKKSKKKVCSLCWLESILEVVFYFCFNFFQKSKSEDEDEDEEMEDEENDSEGDSD